MAPLRLIPPLNEVWWLVVRQEELQLVVKSWINLTSVSCMSWPQLWYSVMVRAIQWCTTCHKTVICDMLFHYVCVAEETFKIKSFFKNQDPEIAPNHTDTDTRKLCSFRLLFTRHIKCSYLLLCVCVCVYIVCTCLWVLRSVITASLNHTRPNCRPVACLEASPCGLMKAH